MTQAVRRRASRSTPARGFHHPGRVIAGAFAVAVAIGTALLSLPIATAGPGRADFLTALFHATSAVCVTGLVTVDTGTYWFGFGQAVIQLCIQAGGLGITTLATLVALLLFRRLGLRARLIAQAETKALSASDVRRVIRRVVVFSLASEAVVATVLGVRFAVGYDQSLPSAAYHGVFHAISSFNNAGFGLNADNLMQYVADPTISLTICAAVIVGGLGFPVVFELAREWRTPKSGSVLTRITVIATIALLAVGTVGFLIAESGNPGTLGPLSTGAKVLAAFTAAVMPRTAGFNNLDIAAYLPETLLLTDALMFTGGGSAGTAGGIKVTTFGLLAYVLWAEMRGDPRRRGRPPQGARHQPAAGAGHRAAGHWRHRGRHLPDGGAHRLHVRPGAVQVISAFSTVGLSTGITADIPPAGQVLLVLLMYVGRIGPLTLATGLALRERARRHQLPEERTIVG